MNALLVIDDSYLNFFSDRINIVRMLDRSVLFGPFCFLGIEQKCLQLSMCFETYFDILIMYMIYLNSFSEL